MADTKRYYFLIRFNQITDEFCNFQVSDESNRLDLLDEASKATYPHSSDIPAALLTTRPTRNNEFPEFHLCRENPDGEIIALLKLDLLPKDAPKPDSIAYAAIIRDTGPNMDFAVGFTSDTESCKDWLRNLLLKLDDSVETEDTCLLWNTTSITGGGIFGTGTLDAAHSSLILIKK